MFILVLYLIMVTAVQLAFISCLKLSVDEKVVYCASQDYNLYAIDADTGTVVWKTYIGATKGGLVVEPGGSLLYFTVTIGPTKPSYVKAVSTVDGSNVWNTSSSSSSSRSSRRSASTSCYYPGQPALSVNFGGIAVGCYNMDETKPSMQLLDSRTGSVKWATPFNVASAATVAANTPAVFHPDGTKLFAAAGSTL